MEFIGRRKELNELNKRYNSERKEFGIIYGRRRIGKSELIKKFLENKLSINFQAKRDNAYGNLKSFSYELTTKLGLPKNFVFASWEEAFDAVIDYANGQRFVLAIDEYPYILEQESNFSSVVQQFIDRAGDNIFLILSGSDVSLLKKEIQNHNSPLYKRRTFEMQITKLSFDEATLFLKDFDNETKCSYLALMSTYPYYLSSINHSLSFEDNLINMLFNQYGAFFSLPDQLLSNSTKVQDVYNAILTAISHRHKNNKSIAEYIHEDESKVAKYLITLQESEIVIKCETFMGNKKTVYYEINDSLLKFWYMFIFPNLERITSNGEVVFEELKDKIKQFLAFGFEDVCRMYINQKNGNGELNTIYPPLKVYHVEKSKLGRSVELDGLASTGDSLLVIECKYRTTKFTKSMFEHLEESVSVFPTKLKKFYYIFSKSGFSEDMSTLTTDNVVLIDLDAMFN